MDEKRTVGVVVICARWGLHIKAGMVVQFLSSCWYLMCFSLYLHLCSLAVHPSQFLYQDPTLFMSLPPPRDLPLTLSLLHPHLYNTACLFAQLFFDHQILKLKAPSSLKVLRNSHPLCTGPYLRRFESSPSR